MKKPVKAKAAPAKPAPKAAQPGNRPGRGKAAHAKPAPKAKPKPVSKAVHQARHAAAVKASKTRAANAKKAKAHPRRQLALGSAVACCSAEALAASLRLAGHAVSDADVLALYWHTARDEHAGASILATLEAAGEFGLAGVQPVSFDPVDLACRERFERPWAARECPCTRTVDYGAEMELAPTWENPFWPLRVPSGPGTASLLLGLSLPAPHAVLDTGAGWMSWGEPWPAWAFPDAVTEEAWEVTWPDTR